MVSLQDQSYIRHAAAADLVVYKVAAAGKAVALVESLGMVIARDRPQVDPVIAICVEGLQSGGQQCVTDAPACCVRQQV